MNNRQLIAALILFTLFAALTSTVSAQTVTVGVSKNDVYTYDYSLSWASTDPSQTIPSEFEEMSKISSIQVNITDITGTTVNTETTLHFKNGTDTTQTGSVDVSSGAIKMNFGYVIARSGMNAGEKVYPFGGEATINDTTQRTYTTGQRETSHRLVEITADNYYEKTELYYDKALGIVVSYAFESRDTSGGYTTTITETLTNTNSDAWSAIPEFPVFAVPLILVAAGATVLLITKKQKKSTSPLLFK